MEKLSILQMLDVTIKIKDLDGWQIPRNPEE